MIYKLMLQYCLMVLLVLTCYLPLARADKQAAPYPYIVATPTGRAYFKMKPDGTGIFYKVGIDRDEPEWQTHGWYAYEVYLSEDGHDLVRLGNWPEGRKPSDKHLAIAFYKDGKLLKKYSTKDLIKNEKMVRPTASHYGYRGDTVGFDVSDRHLFLLETIDGLTYRFDVRTGKIVRTAKAGKIVY